MDDDEEGVIGWAHWVPVKAPPEGAGEKERRRNPEHGFVAEGVDQRSPESEGGEVAPLRMRPQYTPTRCSTSARCAP